MSPMTHVHTAIIKKNEKKVLVRGLSLKNLLGLNIDIKNACLFTSKVK